MASGRLLDLNEKELICAGLALSGKVVEEPIQLITNLGEIDGVDK